MKQYFRLTSMALGLLLLCASCLKGSDNETVRYNDKAIATFALTTINCYHHTVSSTGADSVYMTKIMGSNYKFNIDQMQHLIYNTDSLPKGTDVVHVACNISTLNNGALVLEAIGNDSLYYLGSTTPTDSIDFSQPRRMRVYSSDGDGYVTYTVKVNVHQEDGETFTWCRMADEDAILTAFTDCRVLALDDEILVAGTDGTSTVFYNPLSQNEAARPLLVSRAETSFGADAYANVTVYNGSLYMLNDGQLMRSTDSKEWEQVSTPDLKRLIGSSTKELYGISNNNELMVSTDDGQTWEMEDLDDDSSLLPTEDIAIAYRPYSTNKNVDDVLMGGCRSAESYPDDKGVQLWRKTVDFSDLSVPMPWLYVEVAENNVGSFLPCISSLSLFVYDGNFMAAGICDGSKVIYCSPDGGLTWRKVPKYSLPIRVTADAPLSVTVDAQNFIWVVQAKTGQVWRGRLNRLGWGL